MNITEATTLLYLEDKTEFFTKSFFNTKKVKAKTAHIFFFHDYFDYHQSQNDLNDYFLNQNISYNVSYMDLPSFGFSKKQTEFNLKKIEQACELFVNSIETSSENIFLMGQGLGGLLVLNLILKFTDRISKKISGVILSNPMLRIDSEKSNSIFNKHLSNNFLKINGRDLTSDTLKINLFNSNLLSKTKMKLRDYDEICKMSFELRGQAFFIKTKVLFLLSGQDSIVDANFTKLFLKGIDKSLVTVREYSQSKHDLLNETNNKQVYSSIGDWIAKQI